MTLRSQFNSWHRVAMWLWREDEGPQIAEFAISLPLLVLFLIGIFDFTQAITLKQKLTNAAREAARVAAADPASDMASPTTPLPASVNDAFQVFDTYLLDEKLSDCGLAGVTPTHTGLIWVYTASGSVPCTAGNPLTLKINRGCTSPETVSQTAVLLVETCVTIQYPYAWQYGRVASLIGGPFSGPGSIMTTAVAYNEN